MLMKNWDPPESGRPVLAMERVPGSLESLAVCSSGMFPPPFRVISVPLAVVELNSVPAHLSPARRLFGCRL